MRRGCGGEQGEEGCCKAVSSSHVLTNTLNLVLPSSPSQLAVPGPTGMRAL